jgi:hypothetical protein
MDLQDFPKTGNAASASGAADKLYVFRDNDFRVFWLRSDGLDRQWYNELNQLELGFGLSNFSLVYYENVSPVSSVTLTFPQNDPASIAINRNDVEWIAITKILLDTNSTFTINTSPISSFGRVQGATLGIGTNTLTVNGANLELNNVAIGGGASAPDMYTFQLAHGALSPTAGGRDYYFDLRQDLTAATTANVRGFALPFNGTVKAVTIVPRVGGTAGVGQSAGVDFSLVQKGVQTNLLATSSSSSLSSAFAGPEIHTNLSVSVTAGADYVLKMDTPAFATAPTTVRHDLILFIERE